MANDTPQTTGRYCIVSVRKESGAAPSWRASLRRLVQIGEDAQPAPEEIDLTAATNIFNFDPHAEYEIIIRKVER